ncbi:MAG: cupin domain-containing protein, partial [Acidimicrobiia bacterium]
AIRSRLATADQRETGPFTIACMGTAREQAVATLEEEGLEPHTWENRPGFRYAEHSHPYHKVLFCVDGSITFHTPKGDVPLGAGDRFDIAPGTPHAATVGPEGVTCIEAARYRDGAEPGE